MLTSLFSFALALTMANGLTETEKWQSFKVHYDKSYSHPMEERTRFAIFRDNLQIIEVHNEKYDQGLVSYKMGVNKFTDITQEEFTWLLGFDGSKPNSTKRTSFKASIDSDIPDSINWVDLGAVTPVKDQGSCGSCWSFSATGSIEGQYYIKNHQLVSLSEQNLVDCSSAYGDYGCQGGLMDYAFQYACDNGLMSETDYPYVGLDGTCQFDASKSVVKVKSFEDLTVGSETDLKAAVATVGPVSVAVDATYFQFYQEGVFDDSYCGSDRFSLNHGILAVGYGKTDDGVDYWLVKNSWGEAWGENGYVRMSRNKDNQCGIATAASYPVL